MSEVLWRKVNQGLSAGRVQSPAVRLVVERERERMAFVSADYWDLEAAFPTDPGFTASLVAARRPAGRHRQGLRRPRPASARGRGRPRRGRRPAPGDGSPRADVHGALDRGEAVHARKPKPPFMTSTLQQEGGRKLRMSAAQVMRVAQDLYQSGYITYMRTDSTTLSETALTAARTQVARAVRPRLPARRAPHLRPQGEERPGGPRGHPPGGRDVPHARVAAPASCAATQLAALRPDLEAHGRLPDGRRPGPHRVGPPRPPTTTDGRDAEVGASGRTITFPGYLRAYVEGADDPEAELDDRESLLPRARRGPDALPTAELEAKGHTTSPPARYTEASLVKRLEELGIGRPSTYASIMQTIQDRGYVWKKGTALVPSWTAFAVVQLLEQHFTDLVDYAFTARMEDELDEIARAR